MTKQLEIIREFGVKPSIVPEAEIKQRVAFLEHYLAKSGCNGYVLGISGGQDSLLAGIMAQRAVQMRRDSGATAAFHAVMLPYGSQLDRADAEMAIHTIGPDYAHDIDIKHAVDAFVTTYDTAEGNTIPDFHRGNIKARMRMIAQYAIAGENNLMVIGTDHAAEAVTGFYTKHGDGAADILPLAGLNKRQGRQILQHLGVPKIFITKAPTADLLDSCPGQSDETELGIPYDIIDDYLEGRPVNPQVAAIIEKRHTATHHKRTMPVSYTDPVS